MNHAIDSYIKQCVPIPRYSEFQYQKAVPNATTGLLEIVKDFQQQGANIIMLHSIILFSTNTGAPHQLVDRFGRVIMDYSDSLIMTGMYAVNIVMNSPELKLTLTNSVGSKTTFTAIYQFIYNGPEK